MKERNMKAVKLDLLIVGGGIAGLWCLNRAVQQGYSTLLLENNVLGGGQTICSQGIIHGGAKYSLNGNLSSATQSISAMPERWYRAFKGEGEIDLRETQVLSDTHYLWSINKLTSKVTAFFASKAMKNKARKVKSEAYPEAFAHTEFKGNLYALNERVVDIPSLTSSLCKPHWQRILKLDLLKEGKIISSSNGQIDAIELAEHQLRIEPQRVLFSCGESYNAFKDKLGLDQISMQKRPLHMVMVQHDNGPALFAHAIGASSKPLMTITSHTNDEGKTIWYLGGLIAEEGVAQDSESLIAEAKQKVSEYLPWVELRNAKWGCYRINRAEPEISGQLRPDASFLKQQGNCLIAWPTKLALAPQLSDRLLDSLSQLTHHEDLDLADCEDFSKPKISTPIWESQAEYWS